MTDILIIGGGAIGLSTAYHLAKRNAGNIQLLERNKLTSGTSWHAAGIVGPLRATPNMTQLASHALQLFPALESETGMSTGYRRTGGYWLARDAARLDELNRIADLGCTQGLSPSMVEAAEMGLPMLDIAGVIGALKVPEDGNVNPVDLCMAYARAARDHGVRIRETANVAALLTEAGRATGVRMADGEMIAADRVVLCAGAWSRELAAAASVALPLQAVEHMYVVTQPIEGLPDPFPVLRDLDRGIYIKGDAGKLVIGGFEPNAKCWDPYGPEGDRPFLELPENWDQFAPFMEAALDLVPMLGDTGIQHFMNGPESFTADTRPLVGETPEVDGLFVAAGMNSVGVMSSAGIGRVLADWIADNRPPMNMWEVDVARADPLTAQPAHMAARMEEAVADLFALHWPFKQPKAGRGLRTSPLHDRWASKGAVSGLTAGWERGLWYAQSEAEATLPYSIGAQPWRAIAAREAAVMLDGAVLIDLTPFTKVEVTGRSALAGLNHISTAQLDGPLGRAVYTQFVNAAGGIEADVTVTPLRDDRFHVTSAAATRTRDLAWLRRNLPEGADLTDVTEEFCVIGLMGAASRTILQSLAGSFADKGFGWATDLSINGAPIRATRVSFVGELGWELTAANADAPGLFDALIAAGARPMGHYAVDGCRIEKGFKHWGHDLAPDITPLEAGLGFTIDWGKDFIGKAALSRQREQGLTRRLILMQIEGDALMLHDEPIYEHGAMVGLTTSGGVGARTGLNLAFGMIDIGPGETLAETTARTLTIMVAGQPCQATPLRRPPFDPDGKRMRS